MTNIFRNYPESNPISSRVLDFLWAELTLARVNPNHELWLVSPWISDSSFDLSARGEFRDLWPGYSRSSIPFSEVLTKFLDHGTKLNIVCRPPHLHVFSSEAQNYSGT